MKRLKTALALLALGGIIGWWTVGLVAQSAVNITQSGTWQVEIECSTQTPLTYSLDGSPALPVPNLVWTGTGPYAALVDYPATTAARTLGAHTFALTNPGQTVTLANGSTVTYAAGTVTATVTVYPDPPGNPAPPRILRWLLKISAVVAVSVAVIWYA